VLEAVALSGEEPSFRECVLVFTDGERDVFRAVPYLPPSEWAEMHYVVMDGPYAGSRWRNSITPYLRGIMDAVMEDGVEMVSVAGSPQTGKTAALHIVLAYAADRIAGPRMLAMDNETNMDKVVQNKLLPNYRASSLIRAKMLSSKSTQISWRDGSVTYLACASSDSQRASVSVRVLAMDEEDLYQVQAEKAHPVDEFLERTTSYEDRRKILRISKPLGVQGQSSIEIAVGASDEVRDYHARCPVCQHMQVMQGSGLAALGGETDPAVIRRERLGRYRCESCENLWSDNYRNFAVRNGVWMARRAVSRPVTVGFHLPAFISPFVSLSEILADKLLAEADGTPQKLIHYHNSREARAWRPVVNESSSDDVLACVDREMPARIVPASAAYLTAGVDMQASGFYFSVYAWAVTGEHWVIDHGYLPDFESVRSLVYDTRYERDGGGESPIHRAAMDTGGGEAREGNASMTEQAYKFILSCPRGKLYAVKGAPKSFDRRVMPKVIGKLPSSKMPIAGGLALYFLDTGYYKELVHASLRVDSPHPLHLHQDTGRDFADQITAERQVLVKGKLRWEKVRRDNHYLDCAVYARAAAGVEWAPSLRGLWEHHRKMEDAARRAEERAVRESEAHNPYTRGKSLFGRR